MTVKAYKYRFYPNKEQKINLAQTFGCVRFIYNRMLHARDISYFKHHEKVKESDTSFLLTMMKNHEDYQWLKEVSSVPLQQTLRHLQKAYINFFAGRAKYPRYKKKQSKQSATYARSAFRYNEKTQELKLAKQSKPLNIKWSRNFTGTPLSITITKDSADRYFVSMLVEEEPNLLPVANKTIGIDLGIKDFAITSDGVKFPNMKYTAKYEKRLALAQRRLSKKTKGSNNFHKQRLIVAKLHAKITDSRKDYHHKLSTKLINENDVIFVETLSVKNMVKNRKLSKAISDAGWGQFVSFLEYKANWYGRTLVKIDRWFPSSKRCNSCGHTVDKLPLDVRSWDCHNCSGRLDMDINASLNIKEA